MNANRKANLQRRLAQTPAPPPPAGLAERIKREIPDDLRVETEAARKQPAQWIGLSMRVAASILAVTLGAYVMLRVQSRMPERQLTAVKTERRAKDSLAVKEEKPAAAVIEPQAAAARDKKFATEVPRAFDGANTHQAAGAGRLQNLPVEPARPAPESAVADKQLEEREAQPVAAAAPAVTAAAPAAPAVGGVAETANFAAQAAAKTAKVEEQPARLNVEATISPVSGRLLVRVSATNAPEGNVVVEGAHKVASDLYAVDGERATVRLQYRQDGAVKTLDRTIGRAEAHPWSEASQELKDAVRKAEPPQ